MNKRKLISSALLTSSIWCFPALAEEDLANSVTLYSLGHVSLDYNNSGSDDRFRISSNSSRLGLKAQHTVTNDFILVFQYERGIDLTAKGDNDGNGGEGINNLLTKTRDSFAGFTSSLGTIKAGRQGILNQWVYDFNLFADQVGDLGNIWGGTGIPGRADNAASYETPSFKSAVGDINAVAVYSPEPRVGAEDSVLILKANLKKDAFSASVNHALVNYDSPAENHKTFAFTANFKTQNIDIGGGFQAEQDIGGNLGQDRNAYTIGSAYHFFNKHTIKAQYSYSDSNQSDNDSHQIAAGYDYNLNNKTAIYLAASQTLNKPMSTFTSNNYGHGKAFAPSPGDDPFSISVGLVYKFDFTLN